MSHRHKINELLDQLVVQVTGKKNVKSIEWTRKAALNTYLSVDPKEVLNHYDGLKEKFLIIGRKDLFEALSTLVPSEADELTGQTLKILLELSHKPELLPWLEKSSKQTDSHTTLSWKEIIAEEPLYGSHWDSDVVDSLSSDDDEYEVVAFDSDSSSDSITDRLPGLSTKVKGEQFHDQVAFDLSPCYWNSDSIMTERDLIRECFTGLLGLPTIFVAHITPTVGHMSETVLQSVWNGFAGCISMISTLRENTNLSSVLKPGSCYELLIAEVQLAINQFNSHIIDRQQVLLNVPDSIFSCLAVYDDILDFCKPYLGLELIVKRLVVDDHEIGPPSDNLLIDRLYETCLKWSQSDPEGSIAFRIFYKVLDRYILSLENLDLIDLNRFDQQDFWAQYSMEPIARCFKDMEKSLFMANKSRLFLSILQKPIVPGAGSNPSAKPVALSSIIPSSILSPSAYMDMATQRVTYSWRENSLALNSYVKTRLADSLLLYMEIHFMLHRKISVILDMLVPYDNSPQLKSKIHTGLAAEWPQVPFTLVGDSPKFVKSTFIATVVNGLEPIYEKVWLFLLDCLRLRSSLARRTSVSSLSNFSAQVLISHVLGLVNLQLRLAVSETRQAFDSMPDFQHLVDKHQEIISTVESTIRPEYINIINKVRNGESITVEQRLIAEIIS